MKYKKFSDNRKQSKTLHQDKYLHHLSYKVLCASTVGMVSEHKQIWAAENCALFLNYITN